MECRSGKFCNKYDNVDTCLSVWHLCVALDVKYMNMITFGHMYYPWLTHGNVVKIKLI